MKKKVILFFFTIAFFIFFKSASASTYIQLFPQISSAGYVSDTAGCPITGNINGWKQYSGDFNTGTLILDEPTSQGCDAYDNNFYKLEGGFDNYSLTTPDGNYYMFFTWGGSGYSPDYSGTVYWFGATRAGGIWSSIATPSTNTRIQNIMPANGTITPSTSVYVSFDYYLDSTTAFNDETGLKIALNRVDNTGSDSFISPGVVYDSLTSISHSFTLPTNSIWEATFYFERPNGYLVNEYSLPGALTRFSVVSDPTIGYTTCDINNIAGCFQNAIIYLFYPSDSSVRQFSNLYDTFIHKPPFGYITAINTALQGINDTNASAFTLQSMPILNTYIFNPIRFGLVFVLWTAFAFVLFNRFKNIQL